MGGGLDGVGGGLGGRGGTRRWAGEIGSSALSWGRMASVLILTLLQGVSNIRTLDTPFRKNCSFSTPVPLSLGQPLPYELESFPHQMGVMSSLSCQGGGQGCGGPRTAPA